MDAVVGRSRCGRCACSSCLAQRGTLSALTAILRARFFFVHQSPPGEPFWRVFLVSLHLVRCRRCLCFLPHSQRARMCETMVRIFTASSVLFVMREKATVAQHSRVHACCRGTSKLQRDHGGGCICCLALVCITMLVRGKISVIELLSSHTALRLVLLQVEPLAGWKRCHFATVRHALSLEATLAWHRKCDERLRIHLATGLAHNCTCSITLFL